jgi:hypothetical protein
VRVAAIEARREIASNLRAAAMCRALLMGLVGWWVDSRRASSRLQRLPRCKAGAGAAAAARVA